MTMLPTQIPISREELEQRIRELGPWFHNMDLGGVRTAPNHFLYDYPNVKWQRFAHAIPQDLKGKSVLDIGCNGGFYSIQMKRRGAARVLGIDSDEQFLNQARFAARVMGTDIEFRNLSVYQLGELNEKFDIVLFLGVLYHLRHPLLALDLIYENVASDMLIFQSMQRGSPEIALVKDDYDFWDSDHLDKPGYPKLHFVEHKFSGDETNWWIPNRACVEAMLRSCGFRIEQQAEEEVYICRRSELPAAVDGPRAVYPQRANQEKRHA